MRFRHPGGVQPLGHLGDVQSAQILHHDGQFGVSPDALGAVGREFHPQHRVAGGQRGCGGGQPVRINAGPVKLDVKVSRHPAERHVVVASHPHGVLHGSQRKRCAGVRRVVRRGGDRRGFAPLAQQVLPGGDAGVGGQRSEVDVKTLFAPAAA